MNSTPVKHYFDVDRLTPCTVYTFPVHAINTDRVIGVRDVDHLGDGPSYTVDRERLADTPAEAIALAREDLEDKADELESEITAIHRDLDEIDRLLGSIPLPAGER